MLTKTNPDMVETSMEGLDKAPEIRSKLAENKHMEPEETSNPVEDSWTREVEVEEVIEEAAAMREKRGATMTSQAVVDTREKREATMISQAVADTRERKGATITKQAVADTRERRGAKINRAVVDMKER